MDRLRKSQRWQFETEWGTIETVRIWLRQEGRPIIVVGDWQCPAEVAKQARQWVPKWAPLAVQEFREAGEPKAEPITGLPESLRYFERLRGEDEEYSLASISLQWETDPREHVRRKWKVSSYNREWVDIRDHQDDVSEEILAVGERS